MRNKTTVAMIALVASGSLIFAGCSKQGASEKPADDKMGTTAMDGAKDTPVEIEYWHRLPDNDGMIKVQDAASDFTKENPNIKVKAIKFQGKAGESYEKITAAVKAGNAPCLTQASYNNIPDMLIRGELLDVTEEAAQYKDNYAPGTWAGATLGGKTYGLPQDSGPLVYMYDKDAFDQLGIKAPTTWDEYWDNAKKAAAAGKFTSFFPKDDGFDFWGGVVAAHGGAWYETTGDAWKVSINGDVTKKVAAEWQKSIDEKSTWLGPRWDDKVFDPALKDGKLIGYIGAAWEPAFNLSNLGKDKANWQVAQVPGGKSGPWGGSAIVVLKGCKNPAEALKYANWYNTNMKAMASQGLVPAAKGDVETPKAIADLYGGQNVWAAFAEASNSMNADWLFAPSWTAVSGLFSDALAKGKTLPEATEAAQQGALDTLKKAGIKLAE